jgi:hemerythrin
MTTNVTELFPWKEAYSVRIPEIDAQHKQLIRLINDLHAAMLQRKGAEALDRILGDLVRYTDGHFAFEEALLQKRRYSGLAAHKTEHQQLTKQVVELRARVRAGTLAMTGQVMQFLKEWLANHILTRDQHYARELA